MGAVHDGLLDERNPPGQIGDGDGAAIVFDCHRAVGRSVERCELWVVVFNDGADRAGGQILDGDPTIGRQRLVEQYER